MKRKKEVPADLLAYLKKQDEMKKVALSKLYMLCTMPVRAVKMKMLIDEVSGNDKFRTAIIPAVDIYVSNNPILKEGFLRRDSISYFVAGTRLPFPYGHVYASSGYVCLGNIFVPSAVPIYSASMPIETLFLHNDRNLSHGGAHLAITEEMEKDIKSIIHKERITLSGMACRVKAKRNIIAGDEIWNLSADVASQADLPRALDIMERIYAVMFVKKEDETDEAVRG